MAEELGFPRRKRTEYGRAAKSAFVRPLRKANDPSHAAVTREALDVARYITDMTAQLEAMAIAGRLDLLAYFLRHPANVLSREQILSAVWGYSHNPGTNIVEVYVSYLRRKLGRPGSPAPIVTVRSVGYRLAPTRD